MWVKKQQLKLNMEQWIGSKLGQECIKALYCHLAHLTSMQSALCQMLGESQAGIKIAGRNVNSLRYGDDTTLTAESEEEIMMRVQVGNNKAGLKLNIQTTKTWHLIPSLHGK